VLTTDAPAPRAPARPGVVLAVLSAASFMAALDVFIVNVAFADIGRDFHGESLSNLSWVLNGYTILYAALLVPLGRLADRYGRKNGFLLGLGLFTAASAACAASSGLWMLVAFRIVQAVGAAALTPTSLGLLLAATPIERRARAVRIWAATGALASAAGPVIGGLLVEASWRWVFLVNLPVGVLALVVAIRRVPDSRDAAVTRTPDLLGAVQLAVAIGALSLGLVKGAAWGWSSPATLLSFAVTVAGVALFWHRSNHHPLPVIEPALLRVRAFAWANVTAVLFSTAFGAMLLSAVLWMQDVWQYSALRTGLGIAPGPLMVPIFAAVGQRLHNKVPAGVIVAIGCLFAALGNGLVGLSVGAHANYASEILPGWILGGIGVGFALPTILSAATADLPAHRTSTGSAVVNMSRQIGLTLGVSVLIALIGVRATYSDVHHGFQLGWLAIVVASVLGAITALGMTPKPAPAPATAEPT
jgi:EmrB/QacA subfamily drug resistance transporter